MKLDRTDIKILHELQKNGRITNVELNLSTCRPVHVLYA
jgi:DNA-binding Lrp family transcriptional regulator